MGPRVRSAHVDVLPSTAVPSGAHPAREGREGRSSAMQRRHSRVLAASAAALIAVSLSACASSDRDSGGDGGDDAAAQTGGTLVFGAAGDPAMLDPAFGSDGETFRPVRQI